MKQTKSPKNMPNQQESNDVPDTSPAIVQDSPAQLNAQNAQPPKPLTTLQKVKLMSDLANALGNVEVIEAINKLPSGPEILGIFTQAIEKKLNEIMENKQNAEKETALLMPVLAELKANQEMLSQHLRFYLNSDLVSVLNLLAKNMGSKLPVDQRSMEGMTPAQIQQLQFQQKELEDKQRPQPTPLPQGRIAGLGSI